MNIKKISAVLVAFSIFFVMSAVLVSAQGNPPIGGGNPIRIELQNPFNCGTANCTLFTLLERIINNILLPIGGVLAVLSFIYAGFLYVTAQGNETKLKTAHKALLYTSIGTAVLLGSWVIAKVIENTINNLRT